MISRKDHRIVMTLDAGGTNFAFSAVQAGEKLVKDIVLPAEVIDLPRSLATIVSGFESVLERIGGAAAAISFAFPGPADYPHGIIDNVGNLPAFAGGVALGPYLEDRFQIPVFINNDGDLFAYGESIAGLLPEVNQRLAQADSPKRFETLLGVTLGTGFGAGLVHRGELFIGDNSNASEIWLLRNRIRPDCFAEEGASIRAVRESYSRLAGIPMRDAPTPQEMEAIAAGKQAGNRAAATAAFKELGQVVGDALANAMTLLDGLVVIGGGISHASPLFLPAVLAEMNGSIAAYSGEHVKRMVQQVYDLESPDHWKDFIVGARREIPVPGGSRSVSYDPLKRIGIGITRLGTNRAVSIGAYAFALHQLD